MREPKSHSEKILGSLGILDVSEIKKATLDMARIYRNVFSSPEGRMVLKHLLVGLGIFDPLRHDDIPAVERHNVAVAYLHTMGIGVDDESKENAIDAILNIPVFEDKEEGK